MMHSDGDKKELEKQLLANGRKDFDLEKEYKAKFEPAMQEARKITWEAYEVKMAQDQEHDPNNYMFYIDEIQSRGGGKRVEIGAHIVNYNGGPRPKYRRTFYGPPPDVWRRNPSEKSG
ncbi:hypothetical protein APHAL10511_008746 [Amanita phalloides]|nr:hypothetical protein APHAL10511_008746 [Amanita phalloides]